MNKKSKLRLTLLVMLALLGVFTIGNTIAVLYSRHKAMEEAHLIANRDMDNVLLYTDNLLNSCQVSAINLRSLMGYETLKKEAMYGMLEEFLKANQHLLGVAIGFEPDQVSRHGFITQSCFTYGDEATGFHRIRLDSIYDYTQAAWYADTKAKGAANWGSPLRTSAGILAVPYCLPLFDPDQHFIGVMAVDFSLEGLRQKLSEAAPYPDAMVTLMDRSFAFIAHPNPDYVLNMTLDSLIRMSAVQPNESILVDMQNAVRNLSTYGSGDDERIVCYAPVEKTNWTVAIDCPSRDIFVFVEDIKRGMLFNMIFGLLVFCFVCWKLIKRVEQYEKTAASRAAMLGELSIAANIQQGMLPKLYPAFPDVKELDVYGTLIPAKQVGGDLFDYFIRDDKFFFCIGDVSGKGVPASLFMAVLRSLFRNITLHVDEPSHIAEALNMALSEGNEQNMFCTMFLGVLDINSGHLSYCNCGHNAPIVRRINEKGELNVHYANMKTNIAVGIIDSFPFEQEEIDVRPGEAIFLYTDGVTEAESAEKELYGEDRLLKALANARQHNVRSAKDFIEAVYADVEAFAEPDYQSDDITMVVVEYKGHQSVG